ncbi:MAG: Na+/H+ antiporter NhaA [Planctomycetes bacterium]|nr:Na+/H+ antiporter NhaA [Planctomycetota bacterium]
MANMDHELYERLCEFTPFGKDLHILGYEVTLHWLVNDVFMVFFFGIAAKEIAEACLPGGSLNPIKSAINPLLATVGGVVGPVLVFFGALYVFHGMGLFHEQYDYATLHHGWGIPTATDIALAWLVARTVFGKGHPAINFLLLLAVADDAIGLVIIAVFYGDPAHPAQPQWLGLVAAGMAVAYALRRMNVQQWWIYVFVAGPLAWLGLMKAHLHPALALVPIVPFLPGPRRDTGMFSENDEVDEATSHGLEIPSHHSPLHQFEHQLKLFVDLGLFFFAFTNAGVEFAGIGWMTWTILIALVVGKTVGVVIFGTLAHRIGFKLPEGMTRKDLAMAGFVAALGLTVALFVAAQAFKDPHLQGQAKMGALFSGFVGLVAILLGKMFGFGKQPAKRPLGSDGTKSATTAD